MTPEELLNVFRREVHDEAQPQLWSDEAIYDFMAQAEAEFATRIGGFFEVLPPVTVVAGDAWLPLEPWIMDIYRARVIGQGNIKVMTLTSFERGQWYDDYGINGSIHNYEWQDDTGRVEALITDMDETRLRLWRVPSEDVQIELTVQRLPKAPVSDTQQKFDVQDPRDQYALVHWMQYLAYQSQDVDTYDPDAAERARARFEMYMDQRVQRRMRNRRPGGVVRYGGI